KARSRDPDRANSRRHPNGVDGRQSRRTADPGRKAAAQEESLVELEERGPATRRSRHLLYRISGATLGHGNRPDTRADGGQLDRESMDSGRILARVVDRGGPN